MAFKHRREVVEHDARGRRCSHDRHDAIHGEGFDAHALNTLFLAGPISLDGLLIQCVGRVVRTSPGEDIAEVHDYHDVGTPILAGSLHRRLPGYRTMGFVRASDGKRV
jgi:superfamily II DNA or RNA helicase